MAGDAGDTPYAASGTAVLYIGQRLAGTKSAASLAMVAWDRCTSRTMSNWTARLALKIPLLGQNGDVTTQERFLHEARIAAKIRHPNICPVYDAGRIEGTYYLSMAYIAGNSLAERLNGRTIAESQAVEIATKLARALQVMHELGIVHRDLKAANVMLDPSGEPLLMDFGLGTIWPVTHRRPAPADCSARRPTCRPNRSMAIRPTPAATSTAWA